MPKSHSIKFYHPTVGGLKVQTGADSISWGYSLNTANFPTYGGEVVQILSCYVEDLSITGTIRNYKDLENLYGYFIRYMKAASSGGSRDERPMTFEYPHRGWSFKIIVTDIPGYKKGRDVIAPTWQLKAFVVDEEGDVENLKDLIIAESQIKAAIGSSENQYFGIQGKMRFVDENPFSDPITAQGKEFQSTDSISQIGDYYTSILPSYLQGDFDTIFGGVGSKPSFGGIGSRAGNADADEAARIYAAGQNATAAIGDVIESGVDYIIGDQVEKKGKKK